MTTDGKPLVDDEKKIIHKPVLLEESTSVLGPTSKGVYADLTLGGGGHAAELLRLSHPGGFLLGLDRDPCVLDGARYSLDEYKSRVCIKHGNFNKAAELFSDYVGKVDGVIMDLGLSSFQLDCADRGFSIFKDGPIDLRMDTTQSYTGKDLLNKGKREDLLRAIGVFGEDPKARRIADSILEERQKRPLINTSDVRNLVEQVYGRKGGRIHPATRTFQGLRIFVNKEFESLAEGLDAAFALLKPGGRLSAISFHSGEDRIVKNFIRERAARKQAVALNKKPIRPGPDEIRKNRRSRSALLRAAEKL